MTDPLSDLPLRGTDPVTGLAIPETGMFESGTYVLSQWIRQCVLNSGFVVATQIPANPRPKKLIVCHGVPTGSGKKSLVLAKRRVTIHVYDVSEEIVLRDAEMVRGYLIQGMYSRGSGFRDVDIIGEPCYLPDPDDPAKTPRAQMTVDLLLRARFTPYGGGS